MENFKAKDIAKLVKWILLSVVMIIAVLFIWRRFMHPGKEKETTVIDTSSRLEKVLQISELSTYQVAFNGVADIKDTEGKLLYYVAYEAKVSIGLEMEDIKVTVEEREGEKKKIIASLPEIELTDIDVDPGSLDYIFEDSSADTPNVSITAIPECRKDAEEECRSNDRMLALARDNAENTIQALMQPFLGQQEEYELEIVWGGSNGHGE